MYKMSGISNFNQDDLPAPSLLVIIDPQKDFINEQGNYASRHSGITQILDAGQRILKLLGTADKSNTVIVFSSYKENQFEAGLSLCIPGSPGHAIAIDAENAFLHIEKQDHSCFTSPSFLKYLTDNRIQQLILCGFLAEYCVKQTAIDALAGGYQVTILKDCTGTGDDVQYRREETLEYLEHHGAAIVDSR